MEPIAIARLSEAMASLRIDRNLAKHRQLMSLHEDEAWLEKARNNIVFRLEKLLASLGKSCGIYEPARSKLGETIPCRLLGEYELKGFDRKRLLFTM
jgi:hypothetical protein